MAKAKFYAYFLIDDNEKGITHSWDICKDIVSGRKSVRYKSFSTEKEAMSWLDSGAHYDVNPELKKKKASKIADNEKMRASLKHGIYFDSGTGRGIGVEVRVTDVSGNSLLPEYFSKYVNEFQNIHLGKNVTNNYGELIGLYCALKIAIQKKELNIFGDSNLVIYYWSKGRANFESLNEKTTEYIKKVVDLANEFSKMGGTIEYISGDINPADLGFHK